MKRDENEFKMFHEKECNIYRLIYTDFQIQEKFPSRLVANRSYLYEVELGSNYANRTFYVFFVLRIISGPRVKFVQ